MSEREERNPHIPAWAERERLSDMAWLGENFNEFWNAAQRGFVEFGRGAAIVDTTAQPVSGRGHPMWYGPQVYVEEYGTDDDRRMVAEYDPLREFVAILLKPEDRTSSYRVGFPNQGG